MAKPIPFDAQTDVENFPNGGPETALPVERQGNFTVSCWQLTPDELAMIAQTGTIWLKTSTVDRGGGGERIQPTLAMNADKGALG